MTDRWRRIMRGVARWYLVHLLLFGIAGPLLGFVVLTMSPFAPGDTAVVFALGFALTLVVGLALYFAHDSLSRRRTE